MAGCSSSKKCSRMLSHCPPEYIRQPRSGAKFERQQRADIRRRCVSNTRIDRKFDNDAVTWRQYSESRAQMNDHETIHRIGQSQAEPRTRVRAQAKITVQSSEARPYDQTASPASMEIRGRAIFPGCAARAALKASLEKGEFRLSQNVQFFASTTGFFSTPSFSISTSTSSPAFK